MKMLLILQICLVGAAMSAQNQTRSAPPGPNITIPSAAPLNSTQQRQQTNSITGSPTRNAVTGSATTTGVIQSNPVTGEITGPILPVEPVRPGLIHLPEGTVVTEGANGRGPIADSLDGANAPAAVGTNVTEASGAALATNRVLDAVTSSRQDVFSQQLQNAVTSGGTTAVFVPRTGTVISIVSQAGVVTLQGVAGSDEEKALLERQVQNLAGVRLVQNELLVSNPNP